MWVSLLLLTLGLNISQVTGQDNSTQMYYAKLEIDKSAIDIITKFLEAFAINTNLTVGPLNKTTTCQSVEAGTECTCEPHYRWSDEVCSSNPICCGTEKCSFSTKSSSMCVSNTSVTVSGSLTLQGGNIYEDCLAERNSESFKKCNSNMLEKMKTVYSTLKGFDILTIKDYRVGSIVVIFEMVLANGIDTKVLTEKSILLTKNLSARIELETVGIVSLAMPPNPVEYNSEQKLSCSSKEDLGTPELKLKRGGTVFEITDGTGSTVEMEPMKTNLALKNITKLWAGDYSCVFHNKSPSFIVSHKASAELDVCLLPTIEVYASPAFPLCKGNSDLKNVEVRCEIENSRENYNVNWMTKNITAHIKPKEKVNDSSQAKVVYAAQTVVSCKTQTPEITCNFTNRCNQSRSAKQSIVIINENDDYCKAENEWGNTKAGYTAVLKCKNGPGRRQRRCSAAGKWETENSGCVNQEVSDLLEQANIVDIGLGSLEGNTAQVFSDLKNVTVNSEKINTFPNINGTVEVLNILSKKPKLSPNKTVTDDFLKSSSNILDESLSSVWKSSTDNTRSDSLAEKYLVSVEKLVEISDTGSDSSNTNIAVQAHNCSQGSPCRNQVFNVTVQLKSADPGNVKTTGFQHLEKYLPNNNTQFEPNSIVVATTAENKLKRIGNENDLLEIKIKFVLLKPRPRNVEIQCVAWDSSSHQWSSDGCVWKGPSEEGECVCNHLSSFAILMSKKPLKIVGIEEVTYVALAVSIMSLAISIVIEVIVWSAVVKTNTLYLRHMTHINISICLLIADSCFLASSKPERISPLWCQAFVVLKHFCFLAMFFWMFCLSVMLLHQATFPFHTVSKKNYLKFSVVIGYICPLVIVAVTFLTNKGGEEGVYFSKETCWLVYSGTLKGSIHSFVLPVGIIVFINIFSMVVVIMKLLDRPTNAESSQDKEKRAAMSILRSVVLLTPIFGVTWIFGFGMMLLDLTVGPVAYFFHYAFSVLNAFQGLFILLTTCLGDKLTREALMNRLQNRTSTLMTESTTTSDASLKK